MALTINVIIKVTRACNMECQYCHDRRDEVKFMDFDVMARTIDCFIASGDVDSIRFIWHGGEPLLAGTGFFKKAMAAQQMLHRPEVQVKNTIQTNGLLLTGEWIDLFEEHGIQVGVSLDGPADLHNEQRPLRKGRPSFEMVLSGIKRLQQREIPYGILTVLTENSLKVQPADWINFYRHIDTKQVCFLPVRGDARGRGDSLNQEAYYRFLRELFDEWLQLNDPEFLIREFSDWMMLALFEKGTMCCSTEGCAGTAFSIEPEGDIYHCDKYAGLSEYHYGSIDTFDLSTLPKTTCFKNIYDKECSLPKICSNCYWLTSCNGGCSHDRLLDQNLSGEEPKKCYRKMILNHVHKKIKDHPIVEKLQAKKNEVMEVPV